MSTAPTRRVHRVTAWISVTAVWSARVLRERGLCLGVLLRRDAASSPVEDAMRAMSAWFWVEAATLRWVARALHCLRDFAIMVSAYYPILTDYSLNAQLNLGH